MLVESASTLIVPRCIVMRGGPDAPHAVSAASRMALATSRILEGLWSVSAMHLRFQSDALLAQVRYESAGGELPAARFDSHCVRRLDDSRAGIDAQPIGRDAQGLGRAGKQAGDCHIA